jgi:3-hydroxyisobutyrate dehydrogenase-like beta-hydroxyacid dehydrogenase
VGAIAAAATPTVAVLGLGEAGSAIAAGLAAAGARVRGYDPVVAPTDGLESATGPAAAAEGADVVLAVAGASAAARVAAEVAPALRPEALYADLATAAPALKRTVARVVGPARFCDVALMAPVPGRGVRTPALVSGDGAERFVALLGPLGMSATAIAGGPGAAAARKLARSVFMKGLAAAVAEALEAGERLGAGAWLRADIERTLTEADAALVGRLIDGSRRHAPRRAEEMAAARALLGELGVAPRITTASEGWLRGLAPTTPEPTKP